jgi:hypothetical protein
LEDQPQLASAAQEAKDRKRRIAGFILLREQSIQILLTTTSFSIKVYACLTHHSFHAHFLIYATNLLPSILAKCFVRGVGIT